MKLGRSILAGRVHGRLGGGAREPTKQILQGCRVRAQRLDDAVQRDGCNRRATCFFECVSIATTPAHRHTRPRSGGFRLA
jgi:hypothetical protein